MAKLQADLKEFIELLNSHKVEYLIVGGHAVAFHGHPHFTGDIDFFVRVTPENAQRLLAVLSDFGFGGVFRAAWTIFSWMASPPPEVLASASTRGRAA